jgi:hypothetical protein
VNRILPERRRDRTRLHRPHGRCPSRLGSRRLHRLHTVNRRRLLH